jgi:hypothetical protein
MEHEAHKIAVGQKGGALALHSYVVNAGVRISPEAAVVHKKDAVFVDVAY